MSAFSAWIGVVTGRRQEEYICFMTKINGKLESILVIHDQDYGYYPGKADVRVGVLKPTDKEKKLLFITVSETSRLKNYYEVLTEAQKKICYHCRTALSSFVRKGRTEQYQYCRGA